MKNQIIIRRASRCIGCAVSLALAAAGTAAQSDTTLVGWHTPALSGASNPVFDPSPDEAAAGVAGVLGFMQGGFEVRDTFNSADGTYGTRPVAGGVDGANAVILRTENDQRRRLDVSITNTTGDDLILDAIHFDYGRTFQDGPRSLNVFVLTEQGDLDLQGFPSVFTDADVPLIPFGATDYPDADAPLSTLADNVLAPGETAAFRFQASDAVSEFVGVAIDNVAFSGRIAQVLPRVVVDPGVVLAPLAGRSAGMNLLYVTDDEARRPAGSATLAEGLEQIRSRALRYPGGEVSDNFIWSKDGTGNGAPTLLESQNYAFITDVPGLWDEQANEFTDEVLDFDEFMAVARATDSVTLVVLPFDRMFNFGGTTVNQTVKNFLINNAIDQIRYAQAQGYRVDYWQFGNESNLNQNRQDNRGGQDGPATPEDYGAFVLEFAQAIEAALGPDYADLRLAINGNGTAWFRRTLEVPGLARHIDAITPHAYQFGVLDFDDYVLNRTNLITRVEEGRAAIANADIAQADKDRIEMVVTEYGAFRFEAFDEDVDPLYDQADIARAIMLFEISASLLREPDVTSVMHWVTRWIGNVGDPIIRATDSLTADNQLTSNGVALRLLFERLAGAFVGVTVDAALTEVRAYAVASDQADGISVFLVNRTGTPQPLEVRVPPGVYAATLGATSFASDDGTPYDASPTLAQLPPADVLPDGTTGVDLPAYAILVIDFGPCGDADLAAPFASHGPEDVAAFGLSFDAGAEAMRATPEDDSDFFDWSVFLSRLDEICP